MKRLAQISIALTALASTTRAARHAGGGSTITAKNGDYRQAGRALRCSG